MSVLAKHRRCHTYFGERGRGPRHVNHEPELIKQLIGCKQGNVCFEDACSDHKVGFAYASWHVQAVLGSHRVAAAKLKSICARRSVHKQVLSTKKRSMRSCPCGPAAGPLAGRVEDHEAGEVHVAVGGVPHVKDHVDAEHRAIGGVVNDLEGAVLSMVHEVRLVRCLLGSPGSCPLVPPAGGAVPFPDTLHSGSPRQ